MANVKGVLVFLFLAHSALGDLEVQLKNGQIRGTSYNTSDGKTFYAWRGIPFAKPPIGELRFLAPVPAEPWEGVLDASKDASQCYVFRNPEASRGSHSEDCLYINVYSPFKPDLASNLSAVPVMFWVHGGAMVGGNSEFTSYDPSTLLEEDVIVVTFNYRLGTFGFLTTEDDVLTGNYALKDQLLALQWTRDNIANFGGDPESITLFGESAGSMSVAYHLLSPLSRGLFKGAIMESGSALTDLYQRNARNIAYILASEIDPSITNASTSDQVKKVLQSVDADVIVDLSLSYGTMGGPIVEVKSNSSFLTEPFYEQMKSGNIANVPVIIGFNSEESITFNPGDLTQVAEKAKQFDLRPELLVPNMTLKANISAEYVGKIIHEKYAGENGNLSVNLAGYLRWNSEDIFVRGIHKQAVFHSRLSPVYMYEFSYYGSTSRNNYNVTGAGMVGHAQELGYLFNHPLEAEDDLMTRRRLVKLWTNFAKYSNPTPDDESKELLQNIKWEPIDEANVTLLDIDKDLIIRPSVKKLNKTSFGISSGILTPTIHFIHIK